MPLIKGKSDKSRSKNIKELIEAGHDPKQAAAIAYKTQRQAKSKDDDILEFDETAEAWISKKIEQLINEGYQPDQAKAIAYAEHRRNAKDDDTGKTFKIYDSASKREYDLNGWPEIKDNPISKVGVFQYLGRDISPDLEPNQVYNVYRPESELSDPETINSFKLLPWTDEHAMLGNEDSGLMAAEKKGIHGVIGEDVYYKDGYLKGNIKIFSNKLANLIDKGKKELSIGYRCLYDIVSGVFNGQKYDAIQRQIRGNHLALVDEGRSGSDVAVLDHFKCVFDAGSIKMPDMKRKGEMKDEGMSLEECVKMIKALAEKVDAMSAKMGGDEEEYKKEENEGEGEAKKELANEARHEGDEEGEYKKFVNKAEVEGKGKDKDYDEQESEKIEDEYEDKPDSKEEEEMSQDEEKPGDMSKPKDKKGMDAKIKHLTNEINHLKKQGTKAIFQEISRRDSLAQKLSSHIGTFDHANKTFDEVAQYGVKKLGLRCGAGQEAAMLEGFFAAARRTNVIAGNARDSAIKSGCIDAYLNGGE